MGQVHLCRMCKFSHRKLDKVEAHLQLHTVDGGFQCLKCDAEHREVFAREKDVIRHYRANHMLEFACKHKRCVFSFDSQAGLNFHIVRDHDGYKRRRDMAGPQRYDPVEIARREAVIAADKTPRNRSVAPDETHYLDVKPKKAAPDDEQFAQAWLTRQQQRIQEREARGPSQRTPRQATAEPPRVAAGHSRFLPSGAPMAKRGARMPCPQCDALIAVSSLDSHRALVHSGELHSMTAAAHRTLTTGKKAPTVNYLCTFERCYSLLTSRDVLLRHLRHYHGTDAASLDAAAAHFRELSADNKHCPLCDEETPTHAAFRKHMLLMHRRAAKLTECHVRHCNIGACDNVEFANLRKLQLHLASEHPHLLPHVCSFEGLLRPAAGEKYCTVGRCGRRYATLDALQSHIKAHDPALVCPHEGCARSKPIYYTARKPHAKHAFSPFLSYRSLFVHLRDLHERATGECPSCGKVMGVDALTKHMRKQSCRTDGASAEDVGNVLNTAYESSTDDDDDIADEESDNNEASAANDVSDTDSDDASSASAGATPSQPSTAKRRRASERRDDDSNKRRKQTPASNDNDESSSL